MPSKPFPVSPLRLLQPEAILLLVALGLLGLALWHNALAMVGSDSVAQAPELNPVSDSPPLRTDTPPGVTIGSFNPFAQRDPAASLAAKPGPAPSRLNLTIDGIAHAPQRGGGVVMLRKGSETLVLGEGDEVARGARIVEISSAEVVVDNNGRRETAAIQRPKGGSGSTALEARASFSRYVQTLRADNHDDD